ncbi:guanylate-binding protein 3-like [Pyrus ussuriensis x Pyrus communis]|uniref:Guanylate-binding protein 3-like n=1 Tax=Pyrus ussuriensis x Pyrus communis TaxID=2448454 RepID=A0A5N5GAF6_9ROSA|nr:guanylate-binding protein 3-like [Pyrus ussuriensis x Pyrus communis]
MGPPKLIQLVYCDKNEKFRRDQEAVSIGIVGHAFQGKRIAPLVSLVIAHVQKGYGIGMHHLRKLHWMRLNTIYYYWTMKPVEDKKGHSC